MKFLVLYTINTTNPPLEFGIVFAQTPQGVIDVGLEVVRQGWAKLREGGQKGGEDDEGSRKLLLKEAEEEAKKEGRGIWADVAPARRVGQGMPDDPAAFLQLYKGKPIDGTEGIPCISTLDS